jgi:hypothetical protein
MSPSKHPYPIILGIPRRSLCIKQATRCARQPVYRLLGFTVAMGAGSIPASMTDMSQEKMLVLRHYTHGSSSGA